MNTSTVVFKSLFFTCTSMHHFTSLIYYRTNRMFFTQITHIKYWLHYPKSAPDMEIQRKGSHLLLPCHSQLVFAQSLMSTTLQGCPAALHNACHQAGVDIAPFPSLHLFFFLFTAHLMSLKQRGKTPQETKLFSSLQKPFI